MPDDLDELEKKAWGGFEEALDEYIAKYSKAIDRFLKSRNDPQT
jgi:hypothetical protein